MAGNEQEQDRTEPATPFKLREARSRGQVAKSMELTAWFTVASAVVVGWMQLDALAQGGLSLSRAWLDQAGSVNLTIRSVQSLLTASLSHLLTTFGMFLGVIASASILASIMQTGPVLSWHPLKPDFTRLNPAAGFKRIFNARMIYEAVKTLLKLTLLCAVLYFGLRKAIPALMALESIDIQAHPAWIAKQALRLLLTILALLACIAIVDLVFVKWDFAKRMRMSRRELREEIKRRDGDPKIKAKIRELQREAARRGASLRRVPEADVLITNPTHLSVAVKYERGKTPAPLVVAKGSGDMALRMREKARQCSVPIVESKALARALFRKTPIDGAVPPDTYAAIAGILMWAYRVRRGARAHA